MPQPSLSRRQWLRAGGAALGSLSANAGRGALIGAGVGALGGFLYDQHRKGNID
jgi:hypothetical protein